MSELLLHARSIDDTDRVGRSLAEHLPDGVTISLNGPLGAGKTRLTQAIAVACGIPNHLVLSPTFVLCRLYEGDRTIAHLDAYRIQDDDEFLELGVEEHFGFSSITLVEWGDRVANCLPSTRIDIHISIQQDDIRQFRFSSDDACFEGVARGLTADCGHLISNGPGHC
ncbi:MAG: tRNA (adenosine(37)-N6)-threonylcarbamoyltransferase complex ATPase subunit type 1 TsaE [Pirellulaceae bacterium]